MPLSKAFFPAEAKQFVDSHPFVVYGTEGFEARFRSLRCAARTVEFLGRSTYVKHDVTGEVWTYIKCVLALPERW